MARDLLIDGYNLMHAVGLARRRYGPGDLERCRDRLLKWLARHLTENERLRTTVVFDAKEVPVAGALDLRFRGMIVRFAGMEAEADDLIEMLIDVHSSPRRLVVVSGDRRLQRAARRRRAVFVDSERFHAELLVRAEQVEQGPRRPDPKRGAAVSESEMAAWLTAFGDVCPDELQREIERERPKVKPKPSTSPAPLQPSGEESAAAAPSGPSAVSPPPGRSRRKRPGRSRRSGRGETDGGKGLPAPPDGDEIEFWEQRIAELFNGERPTT